MCKFSFIFAFAMCIGLQSQANGLHPLGTGFEAPTINSYGDVQYSNVGDIVYDYSRAGFYGYNHVTGWAPLGA